MLNWRAFSNTIHRYWMDHMPTGKMEVGSREEMLFLSNELLSETGELGNVIKKIARDGKTPAHMKKLADELGDARIMLHHIEEVFGIDAETCARQKTEYNLNREDWGVKIPRVGTPNRFPDPVI